MVKVLQHMFTNHSWQFTYDDMLQYFCMKNYKTLIYFHTLVLRVKIFHMKLTQHVLIPNLLQVIIHNVRYVRLLLFLSFYTSRSNFIHIHIIIICIIHHIQQPTPKVQDILKKFKDQLQKYNISYYSSCNQLHSFSNESMHEC